MSSVAHAGAPSRLRRGMPGPVSLVPLARLAPDRTEQRKARGGRELGARALIVDAIDDQAAAFYCHFDFHQLDDRRLWRRLADLARGRRVDRCRSAPRTSDHPGFASPALRGLSDGLVAVDHLAAKK